LLEPRRTRLLLREDAVRTAGFFFDFRAVTALRDLVAVERAATAVAFFLVGGFLRVAPKESEAVSVSVIRRTRSRNE
jgi:hypothetical protein